MAHTVIENVGMIQLVVAYMEDAGNQAALTAKNFDVTPHLTRLKGKLDNINKLHTEEEQLKVNVRQKSADFAQAMDDGYRDTSGLVDAMIGILGKGTPAANALQSLRSRIRQNGGHNSPAPNPAPDSRREVTFGKLRGDCFRMEFAFSRPEVGILTRGNAFSVRGTDCGSPEDASVQLGRGPNKLKDHSRQLGSGSGRPANGCGKRGNDSGKRESKSDTLGNDLGTVGNDSD